MKYLLILVLTLVAVGCQKEIKEVRQQPEMQQYAQLATH